MNRVSELQGRIQALEIKLAGMQQAISHLEHHIASLHSEHDRLSRKWLLCHKQERLASLETSMAKENSQLVQMRRQNAQILAVHRSLKDKFLWIEAADLGEWLFWWGLGFTLNLVARKISNITTLADDLLVDPHAALMEPQNWFRLASLLADVEEALTVLSNLIGSGEG